MGKYRVVLPLEPFHGLQQFADHSVPGQFYFFV